MKKDIRRLILDFWRTFQENTFLFRLSSGIAEPYILRKEILNFYVKGDLKNYKEIPCELYKQMQAEGIKNYDPLLPSKICFYSTFLRQNRGFQIFYQNSTNFILVSETS